MVNMSNKIRTLNGLESWYNSNEKEAKEIRNSDLSTEET